MEENDTHTTKVSDSAYSNSCNSQSQRSVSSKSRHSNSSGSSGYCGHPSTLGSGNDVFPHPLVAKRNKDKEHKKKKLKSSGTTATTLDHHADSKAACLSVVVPPGALDVPAGGEVGANAGSPAAVGAAMTPGLENGALQKAAFSQTLTCISKLKTKEAFPAMIPEEVEPAIATATVSQEKEEILNCLKTDQSTQNENEFCTVVSMHDGVVLYTTASITDVLGFPKDMWINRSFIDFVHPKDRIAFASHITSGVALPLKDNHNKASSTNKNFFCCLRQYRGLKSSGFGVTERKVTYLPFRLTITFRELPAADKMIVDDGVESGTQGIFLVITATLVKPAYTQPDETQVSPKFMTRHLASCQLSHVDADVVHHIGFLPQDMLGSSVFDYYHPEDLPFLKEVYESVMKEQCPPFKSKPYRFRTQNGGYVLLETEWSNFINPWSKKLEFVIGQHRILKGPSNPDVFAEPREELLHISEEVVKESKIIQEEIQCLLNEVVLRPSKSSKQQVSKRCKDLATFMESLMDEISKPELKLELPSVEQSFSERDSAMLGEISPHHDSYDSKSSSEVPPSYNQLNYNENIQRFFESKPKTTFSDESGESKTEANRSLNSTDEEGKSLPVADSSLGSSNRKCCSPVNGSGSGSGSSESAGMPGSAASRGDTTATIMSNSSYKPPHLTEALLYRHNEDMEKKMVQKHRKLRSKGGDRESKLRKFTKEKLQLLQDQSHGLKRSGSHSWEGEPFKSVKHPHMDNLLGSVPTGNMAPPPLYSGSTNVNLWPPFSVTVTPLQTTQPCSTMNGFPTGSMSTPPPHLAGMLPMYYIPTMGVQETRFTSQGVAPQEHPGPPPTGMMLQTPYMPQQVPFMNMNMPGMLYHPMQSMYGAPPMMYPSMAMLQHTVIPPTPLVQTSTRTTYKPEKAVPENSTPGTVGPSSKFQRPASQATSVKAEPGSAMGSIASASVKRAMSECSKQEKSKAKEDPTRGSAFSTTRDTECTGDDTSYSSFYSFLKSDESMKDHLLYPGKPEDMLWEKIEQTSGSQEKARPVLKDPPWLEEVKVTPELMYRYQLDDRTLENVLEADLAALKNIHQPLLVNDQLSQLYIDMELEGLSTKLKLEESVTSNSSVEEIYNPAQVHPSVFKNKKKRHSIEYGNLVMIFEENAPLPPPIPSNVRENAPLPLPMPSNVRTNQ